MKNHDLVHSSYTDRNRKQFQRSLNFIFPQPSEIVLSYFGSLRENNSVYCTQRSLVEFYNCMTVELCMRCIQFRGK